ncbi:MAG TPA: DUF4129 domain-containing protein [Actinomycetota bacterium]|nr:DUF4129 domain-containing protein [Actinomycetota bacterium]
MDAGERDGRSGSRRRPILALVALGVLLAGLLWVVAMASQRAAPERAGPARGPLVASPRLLGALYLLLLVLGTVQFVLMIWQAMRRRMGGPPARRSPWRGLRIVAGLVLLCIVLANLALPDWLRLRPGTDEADPAIPETAAGDGVADGGRSLATLGLEVAVFAALLLLLVLAVVARRRRAGAASARMAEDLSALMERSIAELEAEQDPRRAVIAAYAGMEQALAASGLPRDPAEAPLEYLARALMELRVEAPSARRLTELFQRARFSPHQIGAASKQDAIEALVAVRDQLRAAAEAGSAGPGGPVAPAVATVGTGPEPGAGAARGQDAGAGGGGR